MYVCIYICVYRLYTTLYNTNIYILYIYILLPILTNKNMTSYFPAFSFVLFDYVACCNYHLETEAQALVATGVRKATCGRIDGPTSLMDFNQIN